ncbi:MAG: ABC transporter ATP-binding protein [Vicinamibacteria bacterium]|nr:ABC transporter ATP-binding protein [Vicinamibacteria bacterium]
MATATTATGARAERPAVARLVGVSKDFGRVRALGPIDLELRAGQVTALLGPNGAGKTTSVRLLLGLCAPTAGTVRVFGRDPRQPESRYRVGAMLQVARVPETLRVREHLEVFASYYPAPLAVVEALAAAGLERLAERPFGALSGGERQRLLFALALVGDPDLLYLDEPTVALDVEGRRAFWAHVRALAARGKTILLTTHYLDEADALAQRVVVLDRGRIVADGTPTEIKRLASGRRVRVLTGLDDAALGALPGVRELTRQGARAELLTDAPDALVRALLAADPTAAELEVAGAGLEEAFLALTGRGAAGGER